MPKYTLPKYTLPKNLDLVNMEFCTRGMSEPEIREWLARFKPDALAKECVVSVEVPASMEKEVDAWYELLEVPIRHKLRLAPDGKPVSFFNVGDVPEIWYIGVRLAPGEEEN